MTIAPAFTTVPFAPPAPAIPPAPGAATAQPAVKLDELVDRYRRLRDRKKSIADRHKDELKPFTEAMDQLESLILDALNKAGVESVRTQSGTAFKQPRTSYTVKDPHAFREWLEANNRFDLLETRVSKESIEELLKTGAGLPPGIGVSSEYVVNVRK